MSDRPPVESIIQLNSGTVRAEISTNGGWLTSFFGPGGEIVYPKQTLYTSDGQPKIRGGCHVCLPNFGPGGASGLPQHGFGRDVPWIVKHQSSNTVRLELESIEGPYTGLKAVLTYKLVVNALNIKLDLNNSSDATHIVSPGFHPYFVTSVPIIKLNNTVHELDELELPSEFTADNVNFNNGSANYDLQSINLRHWVAWSDRLDDYVCIEPTQSAFSFRNGTSNEEGIHLKPGIDWSCELTIDVKID